MPIINQGQEPCDKFMQFDVTLIYILLIKITLSSIPKIVILYVKLAIIMGKIKK